MDNKLWLRFWLEVFNPVFLEGKSYVDISLISTDEYPVLKKLGSLCTLDILLLAMLINAAKTFNELHVEPISEHDIFETFENYDCSNSDILNSLLKLQSFEWTQIQVDSDSGETFHKILFKPLVKQGIIIPDNEASIGLINNVSEN